MNSKTSKLLRTVLGAGALGFCLRTVLYRVGFDEKNILSSTHPLHLICLALTVSVAVYLLREIRELDGSNDPAVNFPESPLRSLGIFVAACLIAVHSVTLARDVPSPLEAARMVLALGSALSMVLCALVPGRFQGLHNFCHGLISGFFALDMLCRYQNWSGNPQLPDYVFQVFACVLLALSSYHRLAFGTGLGKRQALLFCSLMGLFLCLVCVAGPDSRPFYLGGALWSGACMCTIQPPAEAIEEDIL